MAGPVVVRIRTRRETERWFFWLIGLLAALQLILDAIEPFLNRFVMAVIRLTAALAVGAGSIAFETYKARRPPS